MEHIVYRPQVQNYLVKLLKQSLKKSLNFSFYPQIIREGPTLETKNTYYVLTRCFQQEVAHLQFLQPSKPEAYPVSSKLANLFYNTDPRVLKNSKLILRFKSWGIFWSSSFSPTDKKITQMEIFDKHKKHNFSL